ncbi:hypothetical protein MLD38_029555 [Melastoma candidum]|uniref:Uncharacterized protein n=1 Tax=Melastoma candidum TaxID=119954 RepID=A0ACB9N4B8_9MYRT|nr:hypothetical protein MLD38_029555 [Melastoma candidum]
MASSLPPLFSAEGGSKSHARSVSWPSESHPIAVSVDDAIHRLKSIDDKPTSSFGSISYGLASLEDLHIHIADLLVMASAQQALRQEDRATNALLDSSVLLLDVCRVARDIISQVKEFVQLFRLSIRRRKCDMGNMGGLREYVNFRNKTRKDAKRLISAMKRMQRRLDVTLKSNQDLQASAVMKVLREVDELGMARFQSMLQPFLNPASRTKQSRWLLISRLAHMGKVAIDENPENVDKLESIDAAIYALSKCTSNDAETTEIQLQHAEENINDLELALESMFRQLVRSRACLLNVISQ